ncbi:hypothetical protein HU200_039284 [Digitaria exilis]|uniref:Uncharacterized protein n=1 Tax=Digitaria exilis TaxID=1010633 RepID=A0A835EL28_9POAL|nr:hypothetical protein HU200_039284 [Digitaria exilis]
MERAPAQRPEVAVATETGGPYTFLELAYKKTVASDAPGGVHGVVVLSLAAGEALKWAYIVGGGFAVLLGGSRQDRAPPLNAAAALVHQGPVPAARR